MTSPVSSLAEYHLRMRLKPFGRVPPRYDSTDLGSGRRISVDWSTSCGARDSEKTRNEDAVRWIFLKTEAGPVLLLALADGVTSSSCGHWASRVACAAALKAMHGPALEAYGQKGEVAKTEQLSSVIEAGLAGADASLAELLGRLRAEPERYWSLDEEPYLATWRYVLERSQVFQTTLCLAIVDASGVIIGTIGDSLAALRRCRDNVYYDTVIGGPRQGEHQTALINGDNSYQLTQDSFVRASFISQGYDGSLALVLASDGVARHITSTGVLDSLHDFRTNTRGWARQVFRGLRKQGAGDDNMTLVGVVASASNRSESRCVDQVQERLGTGYDRTR